MASTPDGSWRRTFLLKSPARKEYNSSSPQENIKEQLDIGTRQRLVARDLDMRFIDPRTGSEVHAIGGLNLEIEAETFTCIVGPSGCGKTTFLRIVAGLTRQTGGKVLLNGIAIEGPGADRGMVFQNYGIFPWKTASENVEFGLKIKGVPKEERQQVAARYLELVGLNGFEGRYPRELSGGMQQRVAVARALANQPSILLMDEPFASVDALTRQTLQEELTRIWNQERTTVIFVTHSVDEAIFLADRVMVFASRPAQVCASLEVNLPRPRLWKEMQIDPAFNALRRQVLEIVQEEAAKGLQIPSSQ